MSDVIDLLEKLGQDSQLRYASNAVLDRALSDAKISPELRVALASGDRRSLEALLGASTNVCCVVFVPKPEKDDEPTSEPTRECA